MTLPPVTELLPHKDQMVLIDEVVSFSEEEKCITVSVNVTEDSTFYDAAVGGVPNLVAIEYMAQASAALAEMAQKIKDSSVKNISFRRRMFLMMERQPHSSATLKMSRVRWSRWRH